MGYPMTWPRLVSRNRLQGDYDGGDETRSIGGIAGDMRRLEKDTRDDLHLRTYSELSGATLEQVSVILDAFFNGSV